MLHVCCYARALTALTRGNLSLWRRRRRRTAASRLRFVYAPGSGQSTVYAFSTATPLQPSSWARLGGALPWHRNGCVILRDDGRHYVFFGEAGPLPGLGVATTTDFITFATLNTTWLKPDTAQDEIVIEASTPPVRLSSGDYLFFYSAGTTGVSGIRVVVGGARTNVQATMDRKQRQWRR